ncbi:MAG: hypothetical protein ACODAJ_14695 [Planctomycetota bacterium]|jgi:hypothetical protein
MKRGISHDWAEETPEAKARWFQSLTVQERLDIFCELAELVLQANPKLMDAKRAEPVPGRVQVLERS